MILSNKFLLCVVLELVKWYKVLPLLVRKRKVWKLYLYAHVESDTKKGDFDNLQTLQISNKFLHWFHQHANGAIPFSMNTTTLKIFDMYKILLIPESLNAIKKTYKKACLDTDTQYFSPYLIKHIAETTYQLPHLWSWIISKYK